MSYGIEIVNGHNRVIIDGDSEPYVLHSIETYDLIPGNPGQGDNGGPWNGWATVSGGIPLPTPEALVFFPWDAVRRGGFVDWVDPASLLASCRVHSDAANARIAVAVPSSQSEYRVHSSAWGLSVNKAGGGEAYDGRKPLLQVTGSHIGNNILRNETVPLDAGGGNYIAQSSSDLGISDWIWASGGLRWSAHNTGIMTAEFTEHAGDWGSIPSRPSNCFHSALFATINL